MLDGGIFEFLDEQKKRLHSTDHPIESGGGTKSLWIPPTAYMAQAFFSHDMAVYTLGGYSWRHCSDF